MSTKKKVVVITGASGSGKSTLAQKLAEDLGIKPIITHTTRPPRSYEQDGKDYYFETEESFFKNHLVENVKYGNYRYGSSEEGLKKAWEHNDIVSIVVETQGAKTYLDTFKDQVIAIYLAVDSLQELKKRLIKRGDDPQRIEQRLKSDELKRDLEVPEYLKNRVYEVKNNNFNKMLSKVEEIIANETQ